MKESNTLDSVTIIPRDNQGNKRRQLKAAMLRLASGDVVTIIDWRATEMMSKPLTKEINAKLARIIIEKVILKYSLEEVEDNNSTTYDWWISKGVTLEYNKIKHTLRLVTK